MAYRRKKETGFSAAEVMIGVALLSLGISIVTYLLGWVYSVKEARKYYGGQDPAALEQEIGSGPEFGSFRIIARSTADWASSPRWVSTT